MKAVSREKFRISTILSPIFLDEGAQLRRRKSSLAKGNHLLRHRRPSARLFCQAIEEPRYWKKINRYADCELSNQVTASVAQLNFVPPYTKCPERPYWECRSTSSTARINAPTSN